MELRHFEITAEGIRSGRITVAEAVEPVMRCVSLTGGLMEYIADVSLLTGEQLLAYAVWYYHREVSEGGHEKFLYDPAGMLWREAIVGLHEIGAEKAAENLRELRGRFVPELSFDQQERIRQIEEQELYFDDEDSIFRSQADEISRLLTEYVRSNAVSFEFSGDIEIFDT